MREGSDHDLRSAAGALAARYAAARHRERLAAEILHLVRRERDRPIRRGPVEVDLLTRTAQVDGRPLALCPREFALLVALVRADGPLDAAALRRPVLGVARDQGTNALAVHLSRLRSKLGAGLIETVRGRGWRLVDHGRAMDP